MKGHQTSVTHIVVDSKNNSILISISRDKVPLSWSKSHHTLCLHASSVPWRMTLMGDQFWEESEALYPLSHMGPKA